MSLESGKGVLLLSNEEIKQLAFTGWKKRKAGFYSPRNDSDAASTSSDDSALAISWSSSSSSCTDDLKSKQPFLKTFRQRNRVVTRLNFDDCVIQKHRTPYQKRAKVKRFVMNCNNESVTRIADVQLKPEFQNNIANLGQNTIELSKNCNVKSVCSNKYNNDSEIKQHNSHNQRNKIEYARTLSNTQPKPQLEKKIVNTEIKCVELDKYEVQTDLNIDKSVITKCENISVKSNSNINQDHMKDTRPLPNSQWKSSLTCNRVSVFNDTNNTSSSCLEICLSNKCDGSSSPYIVVHQNEMTINTNNEHSEKLIGQNIQGPLSQLCKHPKNIILTSPVIGSCRSIRKSKSTYKVKNTKYVSSTVSHTSHPVIQNNQQEKQHTSSSNVIEIFHPLINVPSVSTNEFQFNSTFSDKDSHNKIKNVIDTEIVQPGSNTHSPVLCCIKTSTSLNADPTNSQSPILGDINNYTISNRDSKHNFQSQVDGVISSDINNEQSFCRDSIPQSPILSTCRKPTLNHGRMFRRTSNLQSPALGLMRHSKVNIAVCQSQILSDIPSSKINPGKTLYIPQSPVLGCIRNCRLRKHQKRKRKRRARDTVQVKNECSDVQSSLSYDKGEHCDNLVEHNSESSTLPDCKKLDALQKLPLDVYDEENEIQRRMFDVTKCVTPTLSDIPILDDDRNEILNTKNHVDTELEHDMNCSKVSLNPSGLRENSFTNEFKFPLNKMCLMNEISQLETGINEKLSASPNSQKSDVLIISFETQNINVVIDQPEISNVTQVMSCSAPDIDCIVFNTQKLSQINDTLKIERSVNFHSDNEVILPTESSDTQKSKSVTMNEETKPNVIVTELSSSSLLIESMSSQEPTSLHQLNKQLIQESGSSHVGAISQSVSPPTESGEGITSSSNGSQNNTGPDLSPQHHHKTLPNMDSAKKKKKRVKKNGLAARLQKLLTRQRSAARMWQHEVGSTNRVTSKGTLLVVTKVWMEFTHTLVLCSPRLNQPALGNFPAGEKQQNCSSGDSLKEFNFAWIVVLDVETMPPKRLECHSTIKIYPPWQTLRVSRLNVNLILSVTHVEVISTSTLPKKIAEQPPEISSLKEFGCLCLQDEPAQQGCMLELPRCGLDLLELLFPLQSSASHPQPTNCQLLSVSEEMAQQRGTVVEAVSNHNHALIGNIWLMLSIHRVFCYRQCGPEQLRDEEMSRIKPSKHNLIWSVLGEDVAGEICEVILGSQPTMDDKSVEWRQLMDGTAWGSTFRFTGLTVIKRISRHKAPGLWTVVQATEDATTGSQNSSKSNAQLFLHVLSTASDICEITYISSAEKYPTLPRTDNLTTVLKQAKLGNCSRHTVIAKMLALSNNNLYLTDTSLSCGEPNEDNPLYVIISINFSCIVPNEVLSRRGSVVYIQDLQIYKGQLYADKYSRLLLAKERSSTFAATVDTDLIISISSVQPLIVHMRSSSLANELVTITGSIVGIDEETAFAWPACAQCSNDMLCELEDGLYFCQICNENAQVFTMMSLEVFVSCSAMPKHCQVKVKLKQESISALLPPTQNNGQGYEMASVLNKIVGPLLCVVLKVKTTSKDNKDILTFLLEETPSWEEHIQAQIQEIDTIMELDSK